MNPTHLPPNLQPLFADGLHNAFEALQKILARPVRYHVPEVALLPFAAMPDYLAHSIPVEAPCIRVHQTFSGPLNGATVFALDIHQARKIVTLLTGKTRIRSLDILTPSEDDIIREIGGILCNALVGTFSNHLRLRLHFSLPQTSTHSLEDLLLQLPAPAAPPERVLASQVRFEVQQVDVLGHMLVLMDISTTETFLAALNEAAS